MKKDNKNNLSQEMVGHKILENIRIKMKSDGKKANELSKQFEIVIIDFADCVSEYYRKHAINEKKFKYEDEIIADMNSKKLISVLNEKDYISLFNDYVLCYFHTCILIRNEILTKKNPTLFYSYMFNLVHFLELVIKYLCVSDVKGFLQIDTNHNVKKLYESKKEQILLLGINIQYYNKLMELLNEIRNMIKTDDFAVAFKYPVSKDLETQIIKEDIFEIDIDKIEKIVDRHKILLYIVLDIYFLGKCSNYKELIEITKSNREKWNEIISDMTKEQ